MFGTNKKPIDATINTRVDPLDAMKAAIDKATSEAEKAGVRPAAIRDFAEGLLGLYRRRALHAAEMLNQTRPELAAAVAVTEEKRREAERLQSERDWQESINRRFEEQRIRDENR